MSLLLTSLFTRLAFFGQSKALESLRLAALNALLQLLQDKCYGWKFFVFNPYEFVFYHNACLMSVVHEVIFYSEAWQLS
jgi:hypothetical protein